MIDTLFSLGVYVEYLLMGAALLALIPLIFKSVSDIKKDPHYRKRNLINVGLILGCIFLINQVLLFSGSVKIPFYDGTQITYIERSFFIFHRKTDLYLRYDPEIDARIWMSRRNDEYYPFFVEREF